MRPLVAVLTLATFLVACTHEVPRASVPVRHYRVDWAAADVPVLHRGGLLVQGLVFTPAQWPLEVSLKHLLAADFAGVIEGLDLRFHSSTVPTGALERLYEDGYLPAYVRVENSGQTPLSFHPQALSVRVDSDTMLPAVAPEELPRAQRRIDWPQVGSVVVAVALLAVLAVAAARDNGSGYTQLGGHVHINPDFLSEPYALPAGLARGSSPGHTSTQVLPDTGLLRAATLAPGAVREGFVLSERAGLAHRPACAGALNPGRQATAARLARSPRRGASRFPSREARGGFRAESHGKDRAGSKARSSHLVAKACGSANPVLP